MSGRRPGAVSQREWPPAGTVQSNAAQKPRLNGGQRHTTAARNRTGALRTARRTRGRCSLPASLATKTATPQELLISQKTRPVSTSPVQSHAHNAKVIQILVRAPLLINLSAADANWSRFFFPVSRYASIISSGNTHNEWCGVLLRVPDLS